MTPIDALVYRYRLWHYREKPLPRIGLTAGAMLPAWLVRLVAAAAGCCALGVAGLGSPLPPALTIVLMVASAVWTMVRPGHAAALTTVVVAALIVAVTPGGIGAGSLAVMAAGYVAWRLSMAADLVSIGARMAVKALLTWRDAVVLLAACLIGLAARLPGAGPVAVVLGALALTGAGVLIWAASRKGR